MKISDLVSSNSVTLQELVDGLNALGIGPRDMISILQAIKAAGALQAEIELLRKAINMNNIQNNLQELF